MQSVKVAPFDANLSGVVPVTAARLARRRSQGVTAALLFVSGHGRPSRRGRRRPGSGVSAAPPAALVGRSDVQPLPRDGPRRRAREGPRAEVPAPRPLTPRAARARRASDPPPQASRRAGGRREVKRRFSFGQDSDVYNSLSCVTQTFLIIHSKTVFEKGLRSTPTDPISVRLELLSPSPSIHLLRPLPYPPSPLPPQPFPTSSICSSPSLSPPSAPSLLPLSPSLPPLPSPSFLPAFRRVRSPLRLLAAPHLYSISRPPLERPFVHFLCPLTSAKHPISSS